MPRITIICVVGIAIVLLTSARIPAQGGYVWDLPAGLRAPVVPPDNPMSDAKVELGRHLFFDTRLSGNGTQSCGSCHQQARAFTDGRARSVGSTGQTHPGGSMSLVNVAYATVLTWANPTETRLEDQALVPMYGGQPVELGLSRSDRWLATLEQDAEYRRLFTAAYGDTPDLFTRDQVVKAIASFERAIVSASSPYDRYHFDRDDTAISESAKRGEVLFHSRPRACFTCHGGVHFSGSMGPNRLASSVDFHNTGLYDMTRDPKDVGKFKAPTLRNIAITAPYMHDGSVATLEKAIDHYAAGGRTIADGPYQGVGRDNPNRSPTIRGFTLTPGQRADLVAFLESLTDEGLLRDPRFANPGPSPRAAPSSEAQRAPMVAAAANVNFALTEIADQFERERKVHVNLVFGASGTLTRQIQDGAPFDLFLAADEEFPGRLAAAGLTRDAGVVYAVGRLVIFAPNGSPLTVDAGLDGLGRLLAARGVTRFAIANPDVAPYGRAAEAVLRRRALWDPLRPHLVLGDSVAQAAQFATTGNAVGGLIAYSLVLSPGFANRGSYAVISATDHAPLRQRMVLLERANSAAAEFYAYLQSTAARRVFKTHGFEVPD